MQHITITPGTVLALLLVVLLIVGSYWFMRGADRRQPVRGVRRPTRSPNHSAGSGPADARELHARLTLLLKANAGWSEIMAAVNPSGSSANAEILRAVRGPHMFAPALGIQVLQEGCKLALSRNPAATVGDALQLARHSMEKVTRYGD